MNNLQQHMDNIINESHRMWSYIKNAIDFIENKHYESDKYDVEDLLAYCKSCEESLEDIETAVREISCQIWELENEQL